MKSRFSKEKIGLQSFEPFWAASMFFIYVFPGIWGGSVIFDRSDYEEEAYLEDLKRGMVDDFLLAEYLDTKSVHRTHEKRIDEGVRDCIERLVGHVHHQFYHDPYSVVLGSAFSVLVFFIAIVHPLETFMASMAASFLIYSVFYRSIRPTWIFAYLNLILLPIVIAYALYRDSFIYRGRAYKYNSKLDIEILDHG